MSSALVPPATPCHVIENNVPAQVAGLVHGASVHAAVIVRPVDSDGSFKLVRVEQPLSRDPAVTAVASKMAGLNSISNVKASRSAALLMSRSTVVVLPIPSMVSVGG